MSCIRSKNTRPELFLRSQLHKSGFRFRVNSSLITGHPDIYFTKKRIAIFVHGCYWHRHLNCTFSYTPKSNVDFWIRKFTDNMTRDRAVIETLEKNQIRVMVVWECTIKRMMSDNSVCLDYLDKIYNFFSEDTSQYIEL